MLFWHWDKKIIPCRYVCLPLESFPDITNMIFFFELPYCNSKKTVSRISMFFIHVTPWSPSWIREDRLIHWIIYKCLYLYSFIQNIDYVCAYQRFVSFWGLKSSRMFLDVPCLVEAFLPRIIAHLWRTVVQTVDAVENVCSASQVRRSDPCQVDGWLIPSCRRNVTNFSWRFYK